MARYNKKHIRWVIENAKRYTSYSLITQDFNKEFGMAKSVNAFQQFMTKKLGIYLVTDRKAMHYTQAEEKWLVKNYNKHQTYEDLTIALNRLFCKKRAITSVREKCTKQLGLKGMVNPTAYRKGNIKDQCPIGTIKKTNNGCTYIKVKDSTHSFQSGYREPYWLPIQKKVWIDHYGKVPKGNMIIFLDRNRENLKINNLYCIDRKISAIMASNGWYKENGKLTLTAIKWCELFYAMK